MIQSFSFDPPPLHSKPNVSVIRVMIGFQSKSITVKKTGLTEKKLQELTECRGMPCDAMARTDAMLKQIMELEAEITPQPFTGVGRHFIIKFEIF